MNAYEHERLLHHRCLYCHKERPTRVPSDDMVYCSLLHKRVPKMGCCGLFKPDKATADLFKLLRAEELQHKQRLRENPQLLTPKKMSL